MLESRMWGTRIPNTVVLPKADLVTVILSSNRKDGIGKYATESFSFKPQKTQKMVVVVVMWQEKASNPLANRKPPHFNLS